VSLGVAGCEDAYSAAVRYFVRTDPLVLSDKLGDERPYPDSPGQLPLMSAKELLQIPNPYYRAEDKQREDFFEARKLIDPNLLSGKDRQELQDALDKLFGTPSDPKVDGVDEEVVTKLALGKENLKRGSSLYRIHCLHCHGVTGNGRGPTAKWINPHPRDYRQGLFKFQSVDQTLDNPPYLVYPFKPLHTDLVHTLAEGIEGTAMPSFRLLPHADLESLASYVIHLSIRGEAEFETIKTAFEVDQGGLKKKDSDTDSEGYPVNVLNTVTAFIGKKWLDCQDKQIKVPAYPYSEEQTKASMERGKALFLADEVALKKLFPKDEKKLKEMYPKDKRSMNELYGEYMNKLKGAGCVSCHKDYGRQTSYKFDSWGTLVRPADLTRGMYRGGRRPVDFYYRVHSGINGAGMAVFGDKLSPGQIWDIVNFVRILPYPMRKDYGVAID
jgi:mono/diheme cytochrome c family protein